MTEKDNRYFRWAMAIARAEGAISGARKAIEKYSGGKLPELQESENELSTIRDELRDLAVGRTV